MERESAGDPLLALPTCSLPPPSPVPRRPTHSESTMGLGLPNGRLWEGREEELWVGSETPH